MGLNHHHHHHHKQPFSIKWKEKKEFLPQTIIDNKNNHNNDRPASTVSYQAEPPAATNSQLNPNNLQVTKKPLPPPLQKQQHYKS